MRLPRRGSTPAWTRSRRFLCMATRAPSPPRSRSSSSHHAGCFGIEKQREQDHQDHDALSRAYGTAPGRAPYPRPRPRGHLARHRPRTRRAWRAAWATAPVTSTRACAATAPACSSSPLAIVVVAVFWFQIPGPVGDAMRQGIESAVGVAAYATPVLLAVMAWRTLRHPDRNGPWGRQFVGWTAVVLGALGVVHIANGLPRPGEHDRRAAGRRHRRLPVQLLPRRPAHHVGRGAPARPARDLRRAGRGRPPHQRPRDGCALAGGPDRAPHAEARADLRRRRGVRHPVGRRRGRRTSTSRSRSGRPGR